jgi:hypothetical protein
VQYGDPCTYSHQLIGFNNMPDFRLLFVHPSRAAACVRATVEATTGWQLAGNEMAGARL